MKYLALAFMLIATPVAATEMVDLEAHVACTGLYAYTYQNLAEVGDEDVYQKSVDRFALAGKRSFAIGKELGVPDIIVDMAISHATKMMYEIKIGDDENIERFKTLFTGCDGLLGIKNPDERDA